VKLYLGILAILFIGCNKLHPLAGIKDIHPGETSIQEAIRILNEPDRITNALHNSEARVFHWQEYSLQVENKLVQAVFRTPLGPEKSLLYWRHSYRHLPTKMTRLSENDDWQLTIPSEHLAVIYDGSADQVTKVIMYE